MPPLPPVAHELGGDISHTYRNCHRMECATLITEEGELDLRLNEWGNLVGPIGLPHSSLSFSKAKMPRAPEHSRISVTPNNHLLGLKGRRVLSQACSVGPRTTLISRSALGSEASFLPSRWTLPSLLLLPSFILHGIPLNQPLACLTLSLPLQEPKPCPREGTASKHRWPAHLGFAIVGGPQRAIKHAHR